MKARLIGDSSSPEFANMLLQLGEEKVATDEDGLIDITPYGTVGSTEDELIDRVFPNFRARYEDTKRAIFAQKKSLFTPVYKPF